MKLSNRLTAIFNLVEESRVIADIGCDHALLPIALVEAGKCTQAYACDINVGPLKRAQEAIQLHGLEEHISAVLCDGLDALSNDVDCIVIAGMGYETIKGILEKNIQKLSQFKQIILQSNNHVEDLRVWMSEHGFKIHAEALVYEHHYYQVLSVSKAQEAKLTCEQCRFGIYLDTHPLFQSYWESILCKQEAILCKLQPEHESYQKTKHYIASIKQKLQKNMM